ncbi:DUF1190 family protein [Tatumella terrea]|uniref:DUF1190 family protein n=1 Tax=Tatumella terrea TaxID=419007 RepID=A0ABW1W4E1_9GAMM|nr:DUF1190 family protein [Tatumella sp. JGM118]MBS0910263.1 DUF1190 family protein [Tatumella sp. JGM118]
MKRTKNIRHAAFRKGWQPRHLTPVAMAISAVFMVTGCEQKDEKVSMYMNADQCSQANPGQSTQCTSAYNSAAKEAARTAPKYATREDCVAEFGDNQCQQVPAAAGTEAQHSSSPWMPLMAGYMMGRMMGGGMAQPLFSPRSATSPARGQFVDASGRSYGPAAGGRSATVPKSAMTPKPATTTTITRGGFGESVARQMPMQRHSAAPAARSGRTFGG